MNNPASTPSEDNSQVAGDRPGPPLWLLAELTYRCPLHCVFCFNPVNFAKVESELDTDGWLRVLRESRALGSVQCGFSGGEPLVRDDLEILVAEARSLGFYTNLLTSGVGMTEARATALKDAVAKIIAAHEFPMVINCVIHRLNIDYIDKIIEMAIELGAEALELANTQFYSWAKVNQEHLLPSREQLVRAEEVTNRYRDKYGDKIRIIFVVPDYYETRPKKCMNGWGNVFLTINPEGTALPCHTAAMLPGPDFPSVKDHSIEEIWYDSEGPILPGTEE